MNFLAKMLLVCTSLSPVLWVMGVQQYEQGVAWLCWVPWILVGALLVVICGALLKCMSKKATPHQFYIGEFERRDQEMLTYLFIYLLPFLRSVSPTFSSGWLTSGLVLAIIIIAIAQTGAFHFNPAMRLFLGYRFYSVRSSHGVSYLLISKRDLSRPGQEIQTVSLSQGVRLHIGDTNA